MGVQLFFVISGYVLGLGFFRTAKNAQGIGLRRYFVRRLRRLEPLYILVLNIFFVLLLAIERFSFTEGLVHCLASITYLHNFIYLEPSSINTVTWSLEIELQFYILAPFLYGLYRLPPKNRLPILGLAAMMFLATAHLMGDFYLTLLSHGHFFLLGAMISNHWLFPGAQSFGAGVSPCSWCVHFYRNGLRINLGEFGQDGPAFLDICNGNRV